MQTRSCVRVRGGGCGVSKPLLVKDTNSPEKQQERQQGPFQARGHARSEQLFVALLEALLAASTDEPAALVPVAAHDARLSSGHRGLSLAALRGVRSFYAARSALSKAMADVCKEEGFAASVCALTASTGLSLAESVVRVAETAAAGEGGGKGSGGGKGGGSKGGGGEGGGGEGGGGEGGDLVSALVGPATTFFSYSWTGTTLGDMLAAIERTLAPLEAADGVVRYVWVDMFAASQNLLAGRYLPTTAEARAELKRANAAAYRARKEDTDTIFELAIEAVASSHAREVVLYLSPLTGEWRAPNHPYLLPERGEPPADWVRTGPGAITRAWCCFELVKTLAAGCTLHVALSPADVDGFEALLTERFDKVAGIVAAIDVRDAQISKPDDRDYILGEVGKLKGGLGSVTSSVCASLRAWLAGEGRAALGRMATAERGTSKLLNRFARLQQDLGDLEEAAALFREALEARRAKLGDRHPDTLLLLNNLASLLKDKGDLEGAAPLLREALEARRATLGDRHPDTVTSLNNLAGLLHLQGNLEATAPLFREVLEVRRATLGDRHVNTLTALNNLATVLYTKGDLEGAAPLFQEALEGRRAKLGARHPATLSLLNNMASLLKVQGDLETAAALFREALEACRVTLGDRHPDTLISLSNLASLLKDQGDLEAAEALLRESTEACRATLVAGHGIRLRAFGWLADVCRAQGRLSEARSILDENMVLSAAREALGPTVGITLTLEAIEARLRAQEEGGGGLEPLRAVLARMRKVLGPHNPETRRCERELLMAEEEAEAAGAAVAGA